MSKRCAQCGTENADDARFCRGCGTDLLDTTIAKAASAGTKCRVCSHVNRASQRFCAKCGADQMQPPAALPSPAPAPTLAPIDAPMVLPDDDITIIAPARRSAEPPPPPRLRPLPPLPTFTPPAREPAPPPLDPSSPAVAHASSKTKGLWIGLGALVIALAAGAAWWLASSRVAKPAMIEETAAASAPASAPTSIPAPLAQAASAAPAPPAPASAADATLALPQTLPASVAAEAAPSDLWEPIGKSAAAALHADADQLAIDKAARDEKARVLDEQRQLAASAAQDAARRRAEDARMRSAAPARAEAPAPAPVQGYGVAEQCSGRNPISRGICESRECLRSEHAGETVCQRIRAADERRRGN